MCLLHTRLTEFQLNHCCLLYRMISSLMNAHERGCFCLHEISIKVNKLLALLLLHVFIRFFILHFVVGCLLVNSLLFFQPLLLLYFCLFINHVNKPNIFVFWAFVYYFKNTISFFVTIWYLSLLWIAQIRYYTGTYISLLSNNVKTFCKNIKINSNIITSRCMPDHQLEKETNNNRIENFLRKENSVLPCSS